MLYLFRRRTECRSFIPFGIRRKIPAPFRCRRKLEVYIEKSSSKEKEKWGGAVAFVGLVIPFVAAFGWLWWLYQADRLEREPWGLVLKTFALGTAAGLVGLVELVLLMLFLPKQAAYTVGAMVLVPVHVAAIAAVVYWLPFRSPEWNEPFDGLVYGGAAGIGYGLTYTLLALLEGPMTGFRSAVFSIPTFMLAGLITGHYLSQIRFGEPYRRGGMWLRALGYAALALAGVELARSMGGQVMGTDNPVASAFVYSANTVGWILAMWAMDAKHRASQYNPLNYRLPLADTGCPACGSAHVAGAAFCSQCGRNLYGERGEQQG